MQDHGSKPEQDLTWFDGITFPATAGTGDILLPLLCAVLNPIDGHFLGQDFISGHSVSQESSTADEFCGGYSWYKRPAWPSTPRTIQSLQMVSRSKVNTMDFCDNFGLELDRNHPLRKRKVWIHSSTGNFTESVISNDFCNRPKIIEESALQKWSVTMAVHLFKTKCNDGGELLMFLPEHSDTGKWPSTSTLKSDDKFFFFSVALFCGDNVGAQSKGRLLNKTGGKKMWNFCDLAQPRNQRSLIAKDLRR